VDNIIKESIADIDKRGKIIVTRPIVEVDAAGRFVISVEIVIKLFKKVF